MKQTQQTLSESLKQLHDGQKAIVETIRKISLDNHEQTVSLMHRCGMLEAIQHRLLIALSETDAQVHSKIVDEIKVCLSSLDEAAQQDPAVSDHLRSLVQEKPEKKIHLRLVQKNKIH